MEGFLKAGIASTAVGLFACVSATPTNTGGERRAYLIECPGAASSMSNCIKKAIAVVFRRLRHRGIEREPSRYGCRDSQFEPRYRDRHPGHRSQIDCLVQVERPLLLAQPGLRTETMHEATTTDQIVSLLRCRCAALSGVIGIDGTDGVGKTTLATRIQGTTGGTVVSLDDFVLKNRGGYVPNLQLADFRAALAAHERPVIVEGVYLLAALGAASVGLDVLIYIKRVSDYGYWHDQDTCDPHEPEDELIERLSCEAAVFVKRDAQLSKGPKSEHNEVGLTPLREEIIRYHCKYRPSRRAQIVFRR